MRSLHLGSLIRKRWRTRKRRLAPQKIAAYQLLHPSLILMIRRCITLLHRQTSLPRIRNISSSLDGTNMIAQMLGTPKSATARPSSQLNSPLSLFGDTRTRSGCLGWCPLHHRLYLVALAFQAHSIRRTARDSPRKYLTNRKPLPVVGPRPLGLHFWRPLIRRARTLFAIAHFKRDLRRANQTPLIYSRPTGDIRERVTPIHWICYPHAHQPRNHGSLRMRTTPGSVLSHN
jgi:hypothetical protein